MVQFKNKVDDRSIHAQGEQSIRTPDEYVMPLSFHQGLPYLEIHPFSDIEYQNPPHVVMTSDTVWDPSVMDVNRDNTAWLSGQPDMDGVESLHAPFNAVGRYVTQHAVSQRPYSVQIYWANVDTACIGDEISPGSNIFAAQIQPPKRRFDRYARFFLYSDPEVIKHTFTNTTQFARYGWVTIRIWDTHRAPFPALNIKRRNEPVTTDTVYADVAAIDNGATYAQFFVGCDTSVYDIFGMRTDAQFANRLLDDIKTRGAMDQLISDRAQV